MSINTVKRNMIIEVSLLISLKNRKMLKLPFSYENDAKINWISTSFICWLFFKNIF